MQQFWVRYSKCGYASKQPKIKKILKMVKPKTFELMNHDNFSRSWSRSYLESCVHVHYLSILSKFCLFFIHSLTHCGLGFKSQNSYIVCSISRISSRYGKWHAGNFSRGKLDAENAGNYEEEKTLKSARSENIVYNLSSSMTFHFFSSNWII